MNHEGGLNHEEYERSKCTKRIVFLFVILRSFVPFVVKDQRRTAACDVPISTGMAEDLRQSLGKLGENLACAALKQRGYAIIARRYRTKLGEIDVVARDGETTVFVEVKLRTGSGFGGGAVAVNAAKQRKVALMAMDFLVRHRLDDRPCRFDVVAIDAAANPPRVEVYQNAFESIY